ncbi:hypothetical protein C8Q74DRAFT_1210837 [Fomes fomentarius]|nr:hypothetical protein C8Q74DRAFT_1210837 [Fomes fomentarius]
MFNVLSLLTLAFAATSALAVPTSKLTSSACHGLGRGAFDNVAAFTLAAWNSTLPNANSTGVPLVFGSAGAISGASFHVISTLASFPFDDFPTIALKDGRLIPSSPRQVSTGAQNVASGDLLTFVSSNSVDPTQGPQIYCAVADTDPAGHGTGHPFLAVNGNTDEFALCQHGSQNSVVFKPKANTTSYDASSCYPIKVQLIYDY